VTGEVVGFGARKPNKADDERSLADAKACLAAHDPFQRVLDYVERATQRIENGGSGLDDGQVKALIYQTERAAERGVGLYAKRIRSWHQAIVAGAFVAGLCIGGIGAWWWRPASDISGMTCQDQAGGRVCAIWVTPPRQEGAGR
jgi:hypothetical protein